MYIYYKERDEDSIIAPAMRYREIDIDGYTLRDLTTNGKECLASNRKSSSGHFHKAEKTSDLKELAKLASDRDNPFGLEYITNKEFEEVWQKYLIHYQEEWQAAKKKYPIGAKVEAYIEVFFRQGTIIRLNILGVDIFGVANTKECEASKKTGFILGGGHSGNRVAATVSSYDEQNQWLVLNKPQVYPDTKRDIPN